MSHRNRPDYAMRVLFALVCAMVALLLTHWWAAIGLVELLIVGVASYLVVRQVTRLLGRWLRGC